MDRHTCLLVHLDGCLIAIDSDDLTNELVVTDFDLFQRLATRTLQGIVNRSLHTNSYMATPIMSSATTTGLWGGC